MTDGPDRTKSTKLPETHLFLFLYSGFRVPSKIKRKAALPPLIVTAFDDSQRLAPPPTDQLYTGKENIPLPHALQLARFHVDPFTLHISGTYHNFIIPDGQGGETMRAPRASYRIDEFDLESHLGDGSYSEVILAKHK